MAEKSTYIKIDRNITRWRWYQNANTFRVFVHLLIKANIEDYDFESITIHRGEVATSIAALSRELGMSTKEVRVALDHLKGTGEVAITGYSKFSVIAMVCYDKYQSKGQTKGQTKGKQGANEGQQLKNNKEVKEIKEITPAAPDPPYMGGRSPEEYERWRWQ